MYNLSPNVALDVHYRDDEDDVITLNTDNELEDVLSMHALFNQLPTVKFEVFTKNEDASLSCSIISTSTSTTATSSVIPSQFTPWRLNQLSPVEYSPVRSNDKRHTIYGSEQSDDVSLIDLEDGERLMDELQQTPAQDVEEPITYPQQDLEVAALQQEMQRLEAIKIEAPVFISSILGAQPEEVKGEETEDVEEVEEVEETDEEAEDANMTVAAAVVHYETLATRSQKSPTQPTSPTSPTSSSSVTLPFIDFDREITSTDEPKEEPKEEAVKEDAIDTVEDSVEPELPSTTSASTSTSERPHDDDDRALMEQFQLLIKEFQEIIQNNPQLVALAGNIMTKVTSP